MAHKPQANRFTRFFQKVDTQDFDPERCWIWKGAGKGNGYGNVTVNMKQQSAHSYAYQLMVGDVPDGTDVCHSCDNRWCVNPDHLFLGSRQENMDDCLAKGRTDGGNRKHLRESQIQEIRRRVLGGQPHRRVSIDLDVNYQTVVNIMKGISYVGIGE